MDRKYAPEDFPYPMNEDMQTVYDIKEALDNDPEDKIKFSRLSLRIYDLMLTMKSLCITGELRSDTRDELTDYFWGFLL